MLIDHTSKKQQKVDLRHLRLATLIALDASKDPSTKVASIILAPDGRKMSTGYNGFVAGAPESAEVWNDRVLKYPRVLHSELNAILNCPFDTRGTTIYCTLHPCAQCLKAIIQSGIKRVVYYGEPWDREPEPDVVAELRDMVEWRQYADDPIIEQLKLLYS